MLLMDMFLHRGVSMRSDSTKPGQAQATFTWLREKMQEQKIFSFFLSGNPLI
jgi:hypothetical protein